MGRSGHHFPQTEEVYRSPAPLTSLFESDIYNRQKVTYDENVETDAMGWPTRRPVIGDEEVKGGQNVRESGLLRGGRLGQEPPVPGRTINQASIPSPT